MIRLLICCVSLLACTLFWSCTGEPEGQPEATVEKPAAGKENASKFSLTDVKIGGGAGAMKEPDYVTVQHILIAFKGSISKASVTRSKAEAEALAGDVLGKAQAGEDFGALVKKYTDDAVPGIYKMANHKAPPKPGYFQRSGMVAAFGNTGFPLSVGGVGLAPYDMRTSPYGWHIIKRLE